MTAVNNISYYRTNIYRNSKNNSVISIASNAIGADDNTISAIFRRLKELKQSNTPTVVEIRGIEYSYSQNKVFVDKMLAFLACFSRKHKLVKFAVMIGNVRYVL